ncbi:MAG: triose-phosphate isomerase [Desulfurococcaceae archaeon]|nr:triose-phosphate isomerase [Desulfurococcaceae archaeon]
MRRLLVVNFKAYDTAFGAKALELALEASKLSSRLSKVRVILAVPALVASRILAVYDDVYLQHVDPVGFGAYTGFTPLDALRVEGVRGTIINHSEHKVTYRDLALITSRAKLLGLEVLACADTPEEAAAVALLDPTMVAVEPPELIGSGIPVSRAKPEIITRSVEAVRRISNVPILAGAGISEALDAIRAVELGASGVLVASAIMKSKSPELSLRSFAEALEST